MTQHTIKNLRDVEDAAPKFGMAPDVQARFAAGDLGMERSAISLQRLAPNVTQPFGHHHKGQEELYVVLERQRPGQARRRRLRRRQARRGARRARGDARVLGRPRRARVPRLRRAGGGRADAGRRDAAGLVERCVGLDAALAGRERRRFDRGANLLGSLSLALSDRISDAISSAAQQIGAARLGDGCRGALRAPPLPRRPFDRPVAHGARTHVVRHRPPGRPARARGLRRASTAARTAARRRSG